MKRYFLAAVAVCLLGISPATSQIKFLWGISSTYGGTTAPISNGLAFNSTSGPLFATPSSFLQFNSPYTLHFWIMGNSGILNTTVVGSSFVSTAPWSSGVNQTSGMTAAVNNSGSDVGFGLWFFMAHTGLTSTCATSLCADINLINDGNWHMVDVTYDGTTNIMYVDAVQVATVKITASFVPGTSYWELSSSAVGVTLAISMRDVRAYTKVLTASQISAMYALGTSGLIPTGPPFSTNLAAWWPLSSATCNSSGCTEQSGSGAPNMAYDNSAPTLVVTAPTGTVSGTQNMTATCTDAVICQNVLWLIDGAPFGVPQTATPYTLALDTTKLADGVHTLTAFGLNVGGFTAAGTGTFTSSNGVSNKTFYIANSGNNSNSCLSSSLPCLTIPGLMTKINANPLIGGDSVLFHAGDTFTVNNPNFTNGVPASNNNFYLAGPSVTVATQNTYSSLPITVSNYGGSGNCTPLTGVTTDCVTIAATGTTWTYPTSLIYLIGVGNVTVENFIVSGTGNSAAFSSADASYGIIDGSFGGTYGGNNTITNNKIVDVTEGIFESAGTYINNGNASFKYGFTISDNYILGSTITTPLDYGVQINGNQNGGNTNLFPGILESNYINNIGGHGFSTGTGILTAASNVLNEFNVTSNTGRNNTTCGAGYGNWTFHAYHAILANNESFHNPTLPYNGGCDQGPFDLDGGSAANGQGNTKLEYSYGHDSIGTGINVFLENVGTGIYNADVRYNITENAAQAIDSGGFTFAFAQSPPGSSANVYNNTFSTTPSSQQAASIFKCPTTGVIANNIFAPQVNRMIFYEQATTCPGLLWKDNLYYNSSGSGYFWFTGLNPQTICTTLACWQSFIPGGDTNALLNVNPQFASTPPSGGTCYTGTGIPAGPQPCPAGYKLTTGSAAISAGLDLTQAPYNLDVGATDYYGTTIPFSGHGGTGYNLGADGGFH